MNLQFIRSFLVLAEERNFTRAAQRLNIAQPALSQQIQKLEQSLQVSLLSREKRPVELTDAGRHFFAEASDIVDRLMNVARTTQQIQRRKFHPIRIAFTRSAMYSVLPGFLSFLSEAYPNCDLRLFECVGEEQIDLLRGQRIDFGIARDIPAIAGFQQGVLITEPLRVLLPPKHRLARQSSVHIKDLASLPFIAYPNNPSTSFRKRMTEMCLRAGFHPDIAYAASEIQTAIGLVSAGLGFSFVADSVAVKANSVTARPIRGADKHYINTSLIVSYSSSGNSTMVAGAIEELIKQARGFKAAHD